MTKLISEEYRQLNAVLHEADSHYGTSALGYVEMISKMLHQSRAKSLLDYGCGKGVLCDALRPLHPTVNFIEYDPAIESKSQPPMPADILVSIDVMEHIEPDFLDSVLTDIARLTKSHAFISIGLAPAKKILADGRNAHLIIESEEWWLGKLSKHFSVLQKWGGISFGAFSVLVHSKK